MTFKVSSGVALVSDKEFEDFEIKIIEGCAEAAADWFTLSPKHRTKKVLLEMIRKTKR